MNKKIEDILLSCTRSTKILQTNHVQDLWSGYGVINRVRLDNTSVILKLIKFPDIDQHPRGWNTEISHLRKMKSYQVESYWYKNYNLKVENSYSPQYIASGETEDEQYLIIEDLQKKQFKPQSIININQVKQCLSWLAHFHNKYLNNTPTGLWKVGTYWHLETRPDEFDALKDSELKEAAYTIDQKLNNARFKTFVHGDAKLANFLFNENSISAVDFQYVGGGVGVKDVVYFISSIFDENELKKNDQDCLDYYFKELNNTDVEKEWRELYPYAWCDFYRFLQGWSPGHPKINSYSEQMKEKVLACL
jgi:hypothetical protein